jgi:hypothetical protein
MRQRTEIGGGIRYTAALVFLASVGCREEPAEVHGAPADTQPTVVMQPAPPEPPTPGVPETVAEPAVPPPAAVPTERAEPAAKTGAPRAVRSTIPKPAPAEPPLPTAAAAPLPPLASPPPSADTDPRFAVWLQPSGTYRAGEQGSVEVVLTCKGDWHCNEKYPIKFTCDAPTADVTYPQPVVRKDAISVNPQRASARVPFLPAAAGPARVSGKLSFSVCTETQCVIETRPVAATVTVQ